MGEPGRPEGPAFSDEQFQSWLEDMRVFLQQGATIWYACDKAGITPHYWSILKKYKSNDWFSQKIDTYRSYPGELVNNALVMLAQKAADRIKQDLPITKEELEVLKLMAEKHRTSQTFFVNRTETAVADPAKVGKILDTMEGTDYDNLGREASKQMVANDAPVQDKGQTGADSNV
jgi:hypothetical protein